jgi:hypothetical protein
MNKYAAKNKNTIPPAILNSIPTALELSDYLNTLKNTPKAEINKKVLDKHLPTGVIATTGDMLPWPFSLSRLRRRAGRAKELADLADADTSKLDTKILHENPLWSDLKHMIGGALIGGGIGAPITTAIQWTNSRNWGRPLRLKEDYGELTMPGLVAGGAAGALVGFLVSRIKRNRLIRKLKNLALEKGSLKTVTKPLPDGKKWYDEHPQFRKGQVQSRLLSKLYPLGYAENDKGVYIPTLWETADSYNDVCQNITLPIMWPLAIVDKVVHNARTKALAKEEARFNKWYDPNEKSIDINPTELKLLLGAKSKQM